MQICGSDESHPPTDWGRGTPYSLMGVVPPPGSGEFCAPFLCHPGLLVLPLNAVQTLESSMEVKGRWSAGVLEGREELYGEKQEGGMKQVGWWKEGKVIELIKSCGEEAWRNGRDQLVGHS